MSNVLIFTNLDKLRRMDRTKANQLIDYYPDKNAPFTWIQENDGNVSYSIVNSFSNEGIYLIYDQLKDSEFDDILLQFKDKEVFILVHESPGRKGDLYKLNKAFIKVGSHIKDDMFVYDPVFEILTDDKGNKQERIIKLLKPLESKELLNKALEFFDGCMIPHNTDEGFISSYKSLKNDSELAKIIIPFYTGHYEEKGYEQYFSELRSVADSVLSIITERIKKEKLALKQ